VPTSVNLRISYTNLPAGSNPTVVINFASFSQSHTHWFFLMLLLNYADAKIFLSWCIGWLVWMGWMAGPYGKLADNLGGTPNFYS
jgi:hypothetical protein